MRQLGSRANAYAFLRRGTLAVLPSLLALGAAAAAFEQPPVFKASQTLPASAVQGPHHRVADEVRAEGYLHEFTIASDYGNYEAQGDSLLATRLREIGALAALEDVSKTDVFLKSAGDSVLNVGRGVGKVATDPMGTVKGMGEGVKRFAVNLGRTTKRATTAATEKSSDKSSVEKAGETGEDVLGVSRAARRWAQKLGVDPYTTDPVLQKALRDIGRIDASGEIAAKAAVPIPPAVSTTASVSDLVWGKDPEEVRKVNEQRAAELGADKSVAEAFFKSKAFSLTRQTRLIGALHAVRPKGAGDYLRSASEANSEHEAVVYMESAEMLQRFHARTPVTAILTDSRATVAATQDGRAVLLLPLDFVRWWEPTEKALAEIGQRARAELKAKSLEIELTGRMSDMAKARAAALGWKVMENAPAVNPLPE